MNGQFERLYPGDSLVVTNYKNDTFRITKDYDPDGGQFAWDDLMKIDGKSTGNPVSMTWYCSRDVVIGQKWNDFSGRPALIRHLAKQVKGVDARRKPEVLEKAVFDHPDLYVVQYNIYQHGGCSIYTGSLENHYDWMWDCSPAGFIWVSKKDYEANTGKKWNKEDAIKEVDSFVETVNTIMEGNYYCFKIEKMDEDGEYQPWDDLYSVAGGTCDEQVADMIGQFH